MSDSNRIVVLFTGMAMLLRFLLLVIFVSSLQGHAMGWAQDGTPSPLVKPGWRLTFHDEFDRLELDRDVWHTQNAFGIIINDEQQAYVDDVFRIHNGVLHVYALRQPARYRGEVLPFRSGVLTTKDRFFQRYGFFEIRCRLPEGRGFWPAFWALLQRPDDQQQWPPEIDFMEALGSEPKLVTFNSHFRNANGQDGNNYQEFVGPNFTQDFHNFACDWTREGIVWYVDGIERHRTQTGVPHEPMYVLINLAVGGKFPNAKGAPPDESTPVQAALEVDYVRVYQQENSP